MAILRRILSLRRNLLISAMLGLLPLTLFSVLLLGQNYQAQKKAMLAKNLEEARVTAAYVQSWLDSNVRVLRSIQASDVVLHGLRQELIDYFAQQRNSVPGWENLAITDAQGQVITSWLQTTPYVGDREYFRQARATRRPVFSDPIISRATGHQVIVIACPVLRENAFTGIIYAAIPTQTMQQVFTRIPDRRVSMLTLWGTNHTLIARSTINAQMLGRRYDIPAARAMLFAKQGTGLTTSPISGEKVLIGYTAIPTCGWLAVASTPLRVAVMPLTRHIAFILLGSMLAFTLASVWIYNTSRIAGRRAERLAAYARQIGMGEFSARIPHFVESDLNALVASLNQMAQNLEKTEQHASDVLCMISHELKTPLTSIRAALELLMADEPILRTDARMRQVLIIANRQARHLQHVMENFLCMVKASQGPLPTRLAAVPLAKIIADVLPPFAEEAQKKSLVLSTEIPEGLSIMADASLLMLALRNVLDNAVKFTETGSVTLRAMTDGAQVWVRVTDTGQGMATDMLSHLFTIFYQPEPLLTRKAGGNGLGLYVAKQIIEAHGGTIFVESDGPGMGSMVGFTLPSA